MAGSFDPYREWLAIASGQPHSLYDLLGLRPLESDIATINTAFRRQSDRLAPHLSGAQAALAQRLMGELTDARMTLSTPTAKRAYDASLVGGQPAAPTTSAPTIKKSARWSGTPIPPSDDSLLPPTAAPSTPMPSKTPTNPLPAQTPEVQPVPAFSHPPTAHPPSYPTNQSAPGIPTAAPAYPYPAQAYPAPGYATPSYPQAYTPQPASPPSPFGPAPVAQAVATDPTPRVSTFSAASYRAGRRRRSSSGPLAAGILLAALAILGGVYWKMNADRRVAVSGDQETEKTPAPPTRFQRTVERSPRPRPTTTPRTAAPAPVSPPKLEVPPTLPKQQTKSSDPEMPKPDSPKAVPSTEIGPPQPKPDTAPKTVDPAPQPETMAGAEEVAAVDRALQAARAALAARDFAQAQEQIDQATLEATAPDTLAAVERVELLTKYLENFWHAARGTLGKLQAAEEIEIDGEMASVVDASPDRLTLRTAGKNHEYAVDKLPPKIALYLAKRWLTPDDPVSDVALAAFHMTDAKGDRGEARRLLQSAAAGGIDVKPLLAELDAGPQ